MREKGKRNINLKNIFFIWIIPVTLYLIVGLISFHITGQLTKSIIYALAVQIIFSLLINRIRIFRYIRQQHIFPILLFAVLGISILLIIWIGYKPKTEFNKDAILGFAGDYLSAVGAFGLGYYIYMKDQKARREEKKNLCRRLMISLENTDFELLKIQKNKNYDRPAITYESDWLEGFFAYEDLAGHKNPDLKRTLEYHFHVIDDINILLQNGNLQDAVSRIKTYNDADNYSTRKYNRFDAHIELLNVYWDDSVHVKSIPWDEKPETKKLLKKYSDAYFGIIEQYVWNYMIKNRLTWTNDQNLDREIADMFLQHEPFKKIAKYPSDKRIVMKIIHMAFLMMNTRSSLLNYYWDEFSMKDKQG